ncbi:MAG TPA: ABC transporter permease, partial [Marmoricola sp.]|nr:ABC transporter permease [Marmoricola sp.]
MNLTMLGLELKRVFRDKTRLFFSAVLPAFFYVVFGAVQDYADLSIGNGNVAMAVMVAMAAYGAVTATATVGGTAAIERAQGWGRQLGLTPLRDTTYVLTKAALAAIVAMIPLTLIYIVGASTKADGTAKAWLLSALVLVVGSIVFALYGLCFGLA